MAEPIVNPEIPYNGEIPGGLELGRICRIQGVTLPDADRFNINFQAGPNAKPRDDTALHISVRLNQGYVARNTYVDGSWGDEQGNGSLPIGQGQSWEILVLVDHNDFKIAVNGQHYCEFPHRIPFSKVSHLLIDGDVQITLISWEGIAGVVGGESASKASELNAEGPQGVPMGAPPQQFGYGPPGGGYAPGPGGYGPPAGSYGPPPGVYGAPPMPPGAQQESGFSNFLDQAQSMLAGAIANGAAQKLVGGLFSKGNDQQGYAHQNAKYGIYPDIPEELNVDRQATPQNQHQPGPVESLLTRFLSGGNDQQHTQTNVGNQQNTPGQPNQGLDIGSLLSGLLSGNQQGPPQMQSGQSQNDPNAQQHHSADIGSLLSGLLSGGNQQNNQVPTGDAQQKAPGTQQSQGIDLGNLLAGLLSSTRVQPQLLNRDGTAVEQTNPSNQQGTDFGSILTGLLSGGNQQPPTTHSTVGGPYVLPSNASGQTNPQSHQAPDFGSLLSGLLSGHNQQTNPNAPRIAPYTPSQPNVPGNQQSQGLDFGSLLGGLLSGGDQTNRSGMPSNNPQQPSQGNADLGSLLSGLLLGGDGQKQPGSGGYGYQQPGGGNFNNPGSAGGNFGPHPTPATNLGPQPTPPPQPTPAPRPPQIGGNAPQESTNVSKPAVQGEPDDVSDLLEQEMARQGIRTQQSQPDQQYGHYPHPQQQQQQGPIEGLLSGLLSGGGGGGQQQQPQGNIGNLGSVGGLLSSFLTPKDNNRPGY